MKSNKTAIIIHGGSIKGAFAAGVVYGLSKIGIQAADVVIGTGSSVPTSAYFISKQFESIKNIWVNEIGTKKLIDYANLITGRPIFNLSYLIEVVFKQKYPLDVQALTESKSQFMIPLYNYRKGKLEFFSNHQEETKEDFWKILQAAMTIHDEHIVREEGLEQFVDADLDPFALYRQEVIPKGWNILIVVNHKTLENTFKRWLGIRFFRLVQSRHFPEGVKWKLKIRDELIKSGFELFSKFKTEQWPIIIYPPLTMKLGARTLVVRNNEKLGYLFDVGTQAVVDIIGDPESKNALDVFIERSKELSNSRK